MATPVKLKRTFTLGKVPTTADLEDGEVGVNVPDGKVYVRQASSIVLVAETGADWNTTLKNIPAAVLTWAAIDPASKADVASPTFTGVVEAPRIKLTNTSGSVQEIELAFGGIRSASSGAVVMSSSTGGTIYLRPNGDLSTTGQLTLDQSGNLAVAGSVSDSVGDVRKLKVTTANTSRNLATADLNGVIEKTNTGSYTYTIPNSLGTHGDTLTIINSGTSGTITVARGTSVALYRNGTNANTTVGPGSTLTIYRSSTANRWIA